FHRESRLVGVGFRIESRRGVTTVGSARQIDQLGVAKALREYLHDPGQLLLQLLGIAGEALVRPGVGLLDPDDLHLVARRAGLLEALIDDAPVLGAVGIVGILNAGRRLAADSTIDE